MFPGQDPNDCPRDFEDIRKDCNNIKFKDTFGHYRESRFVQVKHHWFWKVKREFHFIKKII